MAGSSLSHFFCLFKCENRGALLENLVLGVTSHWFLLSGSLSRAQFRTARVGFTFRYLLEMRVLFAGEPWEVGHETLGSSGKQNDEAGPQADGRGAVGGAALMKPGRAPAPRMVI